MSRLAALVIMLFVLVGCCAKEPVTPKADPTVLIVHTSVHFHADTAFTAQERASLLEAAMVWRMDTAGLADVTIDFDLDFNSILSLKEHLKDDCILRIDSSHPLVNEDGKWNGIWGLTPPWGGVHNRTEGPIRMLLVMDKLNELNSLKTVVVHEMGHALGLSHVESPHAIMYRSSGANSDDGKICLTRADISEYCRVNECGDVHLVGCERK